VPEARQAAERLGYRVQENPQQNPGEDQEQGPGESPGEQQQCRERDNSDAANCDRPCKIVACLNPVVTRGCHNQSFSSRFPRHCFVKCFRDQADAAPFSCDGPIAAG